MEDMQAKKDFSDVDDNEAGRYYFDAKGKEKILASALKNTKVELFTRLDDHGIVDGKNSSIVTEDFTIKKECRTSVKVNNEMAVAEFKARNWDEDIDITSSISVRKNVDPQDIPLDVLKAMDKYFDIITTPGISKETLASRKSSGDLSEEDYGKLIEEKDTFALKVTKL